ncbi:unnamed protein product [Thelazia callipaeda]|uniref:DNA polymerase n=1 Tax=Thelazia callipaeda TaxID=103827 RepID=A0A0N5CJP5_THECL|nr:unnamed protein product [Thelazia callipaeda]
MDSSSDEELVVRNPYSTQASNERRSSRRSRISDQQELKNRALEAMKRARDIGGVHRVDVANLIKPVYEEVDDEEYMKIIQERQTSDFVVDDDGSGYVDHGVDFLDDELYGTKKPKKLKDRKDKTKRKVIDEFFGASKLKKTKMEVNRPTFFIVLQSTLTITDDPDVEALLNECDLLNSVEENEDESKSSRVTSPITSNPYVRDISAAVKFAPKPIKSVELNTEGCGVANILPSLATGVKESIHFGFEFQNSQEKVDIYSARKTENEYDYAEDPLYSQSNLNKLGSECVVKEFELSESSLKRADKNCEEERNEYSVDNEIVISSFMHEQKSSVLRFYWLDAFEDPIKMPGTVYLFGRLLNNGVCESCCIVVKNIWRQIFVLPREKRLRNEVESDKVNLMQVNEEIQKVLRSFGAKIVKCRPCEKKFAYNDGIVPQNAEVLEVQYSFNCPRLPVDLKGETFSHVFNTTANAMERLLIETKMKGPSWIEISDFSISSPQISYAKNEFTVDMERMKSINVIDCSDPPPNLKLLTINVITAMNDKKENEIVAVTCLFDRKCSITNPTLNRNYLERFCILTKPTLSPYPFDLKVKLKEAEMDTIVYETVNERHLLNQFLCRLQNLDPDAYAGHDLSSQFAVLCSRLEKFKITHWSRLGRLKRSVAIKQITRTKASQWELTAGRFVLDSRSSAMELVRMRSYDLPDLITDLLGTNYDVNNADQNISSNFVNSTKLIKFINSTWINAWFSLAVLVELNALPLFVQITRIVGGVLSRTMMGGRAERNEYLLLHAFSEAGYVAPDKYGPDFNSKKQSSLYSKESLDDAKNSNKTLHNRKAQYVGGLVLDPKIGLYDTIILLLDFNSLYPSIIQEYNICFTTVDLSQKTPELPKETAEGILPREIRALVERRREVKKMMASEKLTQQQKQQYNIRQMGLKLIANSMYGCLGFHQSRFYAKPLAALITAQGREILLHAKDLIEKNGYSVIYGDTDSVMINTGLSGLSEIQQIKKIINQCYQKLEIEIDGIFMKLLLLKKKKYAGLAVDLDDETKMKRDIKGLDIIRRDYSLIVKQIGNEILDIILSTKSQNRDEIVEHINARLRKLKEEMMQGLIQTSVFQIFKQLTRNVDEYADINVQPHAAVARRLNATGKFKFHRGDTVGYIVCEDGSGKSAVQRAYHLSEVQENKNLKIDFHYYIAQQIHPVISRLCVPIEECNEAYIAQTLGLDSSLYQKRAALVENIEDDLILSYTHQNFEHCESFTFKCPNSECTHEFNIRECIIQDICIRMIHSLLFQETGDLKLWLNDCPICRTSLLSNGAYLNNQLQLVLDKAISDYYKSSYVCDDIGCAYRTRTIILTWVKEGIPCPCCKTGLMRREYSAKRLYEQLSFYQTLFDVAKMFENFNEEQRKKIQRESNWADALTLINRLRLLCDQYVADNQYNLVSLSHLFAAMT